MENQMKQIGMLVLSWLVLFMSYPAYGDSKVQITNIKPKHYDEHSNSFQSAPLKIEYDTDSKQFTFTISESPNITVFLINGDSADFLLQVIEKYLQWNQKAIEKEVTLTKELSKLDAEITFWRTATGAVYTGGKEELTLTFASRSSIDHRLAIKFPQFTSEFTKYVSHWPKTLYLDFNDATKLKETLSEEGLQKLIVKANKQVAIEAEFN